MFKHGISWYSFTTNYINGYDRNRSGSAYPGVNYCGPDYCNGIFNQ